MALRSQEDFFHVQVAEALKILLSMNLFFSLVKSPLTQSVGQSQLKFAIFTFTLNCSLFTFFDIVHIQSHVFVAEDSGL